MASGIEPDEVTYNVLIDTHCKNDNLVEAFKLREKMLGNGMRVKAPVYASLIRTLCRMDNFSDALMLLNEMGEQGFSLNFANCSTLIHGIHQVGKMHKATQFLERMIILEWLPSNTKVSDLVMGLMNEPDSEVASNPIKQIA